MVALGLYFGDSGEEVAGDMPITKADKSVLLINRGIIKINISTQKTYHHKSTRLRPIRRPEIKQVHRLTSPRSLILDLALLLACLRIERTRR